MVKSGACRSRRSPSGRASRSGRASGSRSIDGEVVEGASSVDEAPITGESVPVDKARDSAVFAGTLNAHGALTVRATRAAADSTLARVAALVEEAQGSRAPSERFVDRFARVYTPLVFAAALAVAAVPVALGGDVDTWLCRALALLIVGARARS
jgi:Zn2+/Cd2+-exporting ATPase